MHICMYVCTYVPMYVCTYVRRTTDFRHLGDYSHLREVREVRSKTPVHGVWISECMAFKGLGNLSSAGHHGCLAKGYNGTTLKPLHCWRPS